MNRRVLTTITALTAVAALGLVACGESSTDELEFSPPDGSFEDTADDDARADDITDENCELSGVTFDPDGTTVVSGEADASCSRVDIPLTGEYPDRRSDLLIDRPVEIEATGSAEVVGPEGATNSTIFGICLIREEYHRRFVEGTDMEDERRPFARRQLANEDETPCGMFAPRSGDELEPMELTMGFEDVTFEPGVYWLSLAVPNIETEGAEFHYDIELDSTDLGGPVCGNGTVESDPEFSQDCDTGEQTPFSHCNASCQWQSASVLPHYEIRGNNTPDTAYALGRFADVTFSQRIHPGVPEDADWSDVGDENEDWFELEIPEGADAEFRRDEHAGAPENFGEDVELSLYKIGEGGFSNVVAEEFGPRTFQDLPGGTYRLRVTPTEATEDENDVSYSFVYELL